MQPGEVTPQQVRGATPLLLSVSVLGEVEMPETWLWGRMVRIRSLSYRGDATPAGERHPYCVSVYGGWTRERKGGMNHKPTGEIKQKTKGAARVPIRVREEAVEKKNFDFTEVVLLVNFLGRARL